ncbi:aldehyde dehydrogenase family protein [Knoellia sp. S7-12]|uniref:aldehyde dehydrogenase family protein n=1 Tax=Knoellia sp. S7-12 TaxID=3126698 RepID=UPI003368A1AF
MDQYPGVYIDGAWRHSADRDSVAVVNPATEEPFAVVGLATDSDVDEAVWAAERALPGWAATPLPVRRAVVVRVAELLEERAPELARLRSLSMGAPYRSSLKLSNSAGLLQMYLETINEVQFSQVRRDRFGDSLVLRRPVGVVAGIVPWNVPVRNELKKIIPAMLSGCTVVLKPALESPLVAGPLVELLGEAGLPPGVVNLVVGGGHVGEALVRHPTVRKVAFTGSTATGARIAALAGPAMKRLQLELGGKSAAIVLEDADLAATVPSLLAFGFGNSGQICASLTRVLVPRTRHEEVVEALAEGASRLVVGDPMDDRTTMGPLVTKRQRDKVLALVSSGRAEGATLVCGGSAPAGLSRGWYVAPIVFGNVRNDMLIAREEIFGPVVSVIPYDSEAEAVRLANDSRYGLHGAVYSRDDAHALDVALQLDTGTAAVNSFDIPVSAPFGGVKDSGFGRENGVEGYDSFLEYHSYKLTPALAASMSTP